MAMFTVNTHRLDPYKNFKFKVKWEGQYVAGVSKVSALVRTTEVITHREGSDASHFHVSPGPTTFTPITLERGLTHDPAFEEWANQVYNHQGDAAMSLKNYRKDISIDLFNLQGSLTVSFRVYRCWVTEYQALPTLDANANCVAIERIVLQHEGWERDQSVTEPTET